MKQNLTLIDRFGLGLLAALVGLVSIFFVLGISILFFKISFSAYYSLGTFAISISLIDFLGMVVLGFFAIGFITGDKYLVRIFDPLFKFFDYLLEEAFRK